MERKFLGGFLTFLD